MDTIHVGQEQTLIVNPKAVIAVYCSDKNTCVYLSNGGPILQMMIEDLDRKVFKTILEDIRNTLS